MSDKNKVVTIKKYANRRLYNTASSSYVTLEDLCQMVKDDIPFAVYDAKSGEDITRSVLTQIIVEEEAKGQNLLPLSFMRQLIGFYRGSENSMLPQYLDYTMAQFSKNQSQWQDFMKQTFGQTFGSVFPLDAVEQMQKQNMALFEQTMKMFNPFAAAGGADGGDKETISALQQKLDELKKGEKK